MITSPALCCGRYWLFVIPLPLLDTPPAMQVPLLFAK